VDGGAGVVQQLVIFARTRHYLDSGCTWPLGNPKNHGVAGHIYSTGNTHVVVAAAPWPGAAGNPLQQQTYAQSLYATVAQTAALKVQMGVFLGAAIFVKGVKWGVLLLDSDSANLLRTAAGYPKDQPLLETMAEMIGRVLGAV
jgi:hypothetical protein